ncbi:MAG: tetratricopeptide repeat protein, partial [Candidatus Riflebacteria bacterium]|nr:tetratricopeptide repeat protein [Candidatus Riflebacteria bacterium]
KEVMIGGYKSMDKTYEMRKPKVDYTPRDITPERPLTDLEKAVIKIDEEDYAGAESMLKAILKKDSNNGEAYHNLGVVKMSQSNYKEAIKNFEKAAKLNKANSFQSYFLMGNCYRYLGDNNNAEKALKSACDIKYDDFAQFNLGEVKVILGKYKEAEKIYKDILAKSPNFSDASVGLAQIKMEQGKLEEAMNMVNNAISKGNKGEANYVKALLLMENKMSNEALEEVEEAISVSPANVKYRVAKSKILIKMFEYSRGIDEASAILRSSPDSVPAMLVIAEAFALTSATTEATAQIEEVEKRGDFADTHRIKGIIAKADGKEDVAKTEYEEYFKMTGTPSAEFEIAEFYETVENGNPKAMQYYQDIVQSYPGTLYAIKANEALETLKSSSDDSSSPDAAYDPGPSSNYKAGSVKF